MALEDRLNGLIKDQFQSKIELNRLKRQFDEMKSEITLGQNISKHTFRGLLTQSQRIVLDNFELLADELGLTKTQIAMLRTSRADFDAAGSISLSDLMLTESLYAIASWGLQYDGQHVFELTDVERILRGEAPVTDEPIDGELIEPEGA